MITKDCVMVFAWMKKEEPQKFATTNVRVGHGTAVHCAWATNKDGEKIKYPHTFCGAEGTGSAQVRRFDPGITMVTDQPVTCKKCVKAMTRAQEHLGTDTTS